VGGRGDLHVLFGWMDGGGGGRIMEAKGAFENAQQMNLKLVYLRRKEFLLTLSI